MAKKENTDELIVVDAKRYHRVKKAMEAGKTGEAGAAPPLLEEQESTRELVVVDVRRYKKVKKALEVSEERYRQLFENVPIGIYRTTPDGRIIDANPALVKMLGFDSFAELSTRNLEKEYSNAGSKRAFFIKLLESEGEIRGLEAVWKRKDGSAVQVRENAKLVRNEEGQVFFEGTVEDITQSKLAEEAQRIRTQQIEILNCIISKGNMAESVEQMLEVILDCMVMPLAFDTAGIFMLDHESGKVRMLASRGRPTEFAQSDEYMSIEKMPFSMALQRGQAAYLENTREVRHDFYTRWGWHMAGCVPLLSKGRVVGALNVASSQRGAFTPEEKDILEMIGKEAGTLVSKLQTETALRESEKYYRTLIDTSPDIIVAMDLCARMITVNQQFLKVGGYFYDEVIGKSTFDFVDGLERDFLTKKTLTFIEKKKVSGSEYCFKKKDGQAIPLEVSASVLLDDAGHPAGIIAIGRDISERKRAEEALRKSEEKFRSIAEQTSDLIAITDAAGIVTYASSSARTLFQYEPEEMGGHNFMEFLDASSVPKAVAAFRNDLDGGGKSVGLELTMKRKDGSTFAGELNGTSFQYGAQHGSLVVIRDVTERKRAQLDIEEKNKVLAILNELSLELALLPPSEDIVKYISKKMMAITRAIYVGVNYYNKDTRQLEFSNAHTASKSLNELNRVLGTKIKNIKYDVSDAMYKEITSEIVGYRDTLHEVSFGTISEKTSSLVHQLFELEKFIGMALVVEGELIGTVTMAIRRGTPAVSLELLRSISSIVSVSLRRRQAESHLVASEEKFKKLFYISPDSIMLSRLDDSMIVSINKGFSKIMDYQEGEVIGKTTMEIGIFKNPEDHHQVIDALQAEGVIENREFWFVSKSGKDVLGLVSAAIIEFDNEKYVLSTIRDVTERKRAEQELRESKALIDAVVENAPLMIFLKRATDLNFVLFNRAGEELLGHDRARMLGKNDTDLFPAAQAAFFMAKDRETLDGEAGLLDIPEEPIMTAKKGQRLLHTRKLCIGGADGTTKYLLGISEDITERKAAEAKLLAYQEQLRALTSELTLIEERERRRIASELHDQIGQNLALCKLKVAALEKGVIGEELKGELSAVRRLLECSIQDTRSLIFDLSPPVLYELGFPAALEWLVEWIGEQYHMPVEFENRSGDEPMENDRQVILFQVIRELLVNVGKHSQASRAKVILSLEKHALKVQVNDDGVGFDATRIYDPKGKDGRFGFFSMRERLNYLGGSLEVRSKPGQGTQIILVVPQGERPDAGRREDA
jgi:PAS domain S-box-containing protein